MNIQHVFVLMLENRSFDHMLGFSGIQGYDPAYGKRRPVNGPDGSGNTYDGHTYLAQTPGANPMPNDPGHEFLDVVEELCGQGTVYTGGAYPAVTSAGYVANYAAHFADADYQDPLTCFAAKQLPVLCDLATNFVVCDSWYSSMPGPTWPNRFFVHAASAGGLDHSPTLSNIFEWSFSGGFKFQNGTIFDRMHQAELPFRVYSGDATPLVLALHNMTDYYDSFRPYSSFASDLATGDYQAKYTFIEPNYGAVLANTFICGTSQHPVDDVTRGEWLIKCTYESIRSSNLWDTSMLIVTWDEHGGLYDHTLPPSAKPPGDTTIMKDANVHGFTFDQLGTRVPAVVASPLIAPNLIDGTVYDHSTVLATLETIFSLEAMTDRDRSASNLLALATLDEPRSDTPATLAEPASGVLSQCWDLTGCASFTQAASSQAAAGPLLEAPELPLVNDQPGFLLAALQKDLAVTRRAEHPQRVARAQTVTTRAEAAIYFTEVAARARAADEPPTAPRRS